MIMVNRNKNTSNVFFGVVTILITTLILWAVSIYGKMQIDISLDVANISKDQITH